MTLLRDLQCKLSCRDVDDFTRMLPVFPETDIRMCFRRQLVNFPENKKIPSNFSKYFAVMGALVDDGLAGKSLMDVGTGLGIFVLQAKFLGMRATGCDVFGAYGGRCRAGALCCARAYGYCAPDDDNTFVRLDITKPMATHEQYDFITSFGMLEHIHCPQARRVVLENMVKMLAPGGSMLLVCGPNKFFPVDFHHYGPKFVFYHCLSPLLKAIYLKLLARRAKNQDVNWVNGMRVSEISKNIAKIAPGTTVNQVFPLWLHISSSKYLKHGIVRILAVALAQLLCFFKMEPVIILIARKSPENYAG